MTLHESCSPRWLLPGLLLAATAICGHAQSEKKNFDTDSREQQEAVAQAMKQNSYALSLHNGVLQGPGLDFLLQRSARAQFVLFGEEHFVKELPEILGAFFALLHEKYSFNYLAVENDPVSARVASLAPLRGDTSALVEYARRYPNAFTFPTEQEVRLFADAGRYSQGKTDPVWGLDQSFGVLHALDRLQTLPGFRTTSIFEQLHKEAVESDSRRPPRGNHADQLDYMQTVRIDDLKELLRQSAALEGSEARFILDNLVSSSQIYRNFLRSMAGEPTGYASGLEREQQMKQLFLRQYRAAEAQGERNPKVLLKLGSWHVFRGLGPSRLQTLGNFVTEFATANGTEALTVAVYLRGPWRDVSHQKGLEPIALATEPSSWNVIDFAAMRPIVRTGRFGDLDSNLLAQIFGFDAALVIGGASEGTDLLGKSKP